MQSWLFWHAYSLKNKLRPLWQEIDRFASYDPGRARRVIAERLLSQLQYFGRRADALPEWREAASVRNTADLWRLWDSLPILTKRDLATRFRPEDMLRRFGLTGKVSSTGGSTGEPTPYLHSPQMIAVSVASTIFCRLKLGWQFGMPTICMWGSDRDIGKTHSRYQQILARLKNDWVVGGYNLTSETVERVQKIISKRQPVAIYGFTGMLEFFARRVLEKGPILPRGSIRTAWNGGEMLFETQVEIFQEAFGVPILNWYGSRELSVMAYQTRRGAPLEIVRPYLFAEIVDTNGKPVPAGETGRLIWTSTVCQGTPFIRYDIGDLATYAREDLDESGIRKLKELHGRIAGTLRLPNGKIIGCIFWNHLFKEFPEVQQFQVALLKQREIELRFKGERFSPAREAELRRVLSGFAPEVPVTISWLEQIPLTRQGKLVQVVEEP